MMIHPSLIEKIALDPREHNRAVADDLRRSFAYVGPVSVGVRKDADLQAPAVNELRLVARMSRPYWSDADPDGAQMWDAMRTWLAAKAYKVGATVANFNATRAEEGGQTVSYDRLELDMKPYVLGIALPQGDELPALDELAERFRALLGSGAIPADAQGVEMPSTASLAMQRETALAEAAVEPAAGEACAPAAAGPADANAPAAAGPADAEEPAPEETVPEMRVIAEARQPVAHASDGLASVDYARWGVVLADGSVRELDSASGTWL